MTLSGAKPDVETGMIPVLGRGKLLAGEDGDVVARAVSILGISPFIGTLRATDIFGAFGRAAWEADPA